MNKNYLVKLKRLIIVFYIHVHVHVHVHVQGQYIEGGLKKFIVLLHVHVLYL